MEMKIEEIKLSGDAVEAVVRIRGALGAFENYRMKDDILHRVTEELARRVLLDTGPTVMKEITKEQLINATIMRVAGQLSGSECR